MANQPYPGKLRPELRSQFGSILRTREDAKVPIPNAGITLEGRLRPLTDDDIPAVIVGRNELKLVRAFLRHYRSLGVTRFIWIDDASSDGGDLWLRGEADVDVLTSNARFAAATRGRAWREMVVDRLGRNRWYLMLDADEFLVYRNYETVPLAQVIAAVERRGIRHVFAPMIDMYPPGIIEQASYDGEAMPWSVANLFDCDGYIVRPRSRGWYADGGPRKRLFPTSPPPLLTKYPLQYWTKWTAQNKTIHYLAPYWRNFSPALGVLLHFKFFADFEQRFQDIVRNAQHFEKSLHYINILQGLDGPETVFEYDRSAAFENAEQMYRLGFFDDWRA